MKMSKPLKSKRKGSVMPLMLVAVVILFVMGVGFLSLGLHSRIFAQQNASEIAARCAVDVGLTKAVFEMNAKLEAKPWDDSILPEVTGEALPNCDATFRYTVTGDISSGYIIESVGQSGRAQKRVRCALPLQGLFESAISTQGTIELKSNTLISAYNSLDPLDTDGGLKISTNSILLDSVILNSGITVNGDILVGVGGSVEEVIKDLGAVVTGGEYALSEDILFPPITVPVLTDMGAGISVHGATLTIGPADSGKYGGISLKRATNPAVLEIAGGDVVLHVTGGIGMGEECEIVVKEGASLALYLDGDLVTHNNAGINNEGSPKKLKLYGTSQSSQNLDIRAKGKFSGAVYAPNASVTVMAGSDIYGAVNAQSFELKSGGNFYYDKALKNVGVDDEDVRFVITQWQEE